jgi:hypothetical protein
MNGEAQRAGGPVPNRTGSAGFSLVEVALLAILLLTAVGGLASAVLSSLTLSRTSEESALADDAVHALAAEMQTGAFLDLFRMYNGDPGDDPAGPGTAPGQHFDVRGLTPRADDPDGRVGRIVFPAVPNGAGGEELREDVVDPRLGMEEGVGRDLNGDGDALDAVSTEYLVLPLRFVVEWTGAGGERLLERNFVLVP